MSFTVQRISSSSANFISLTSGYDTSILHDWAKCIRYINFLYIYYFCLSLALESGLLFTKDFRGYQ
jgi:hypothetical protein